MNFLRVSLLLAGMTALFMVAGLMLGGEGGMLIALLVAAGMNVFAYWNSANMVLRMYRAKQVDARTSPRLYNIVSELARRAELPMPKVYIIENDQPNAFATGRSPNHAAVAATTGIMRLLNDQELAGVMAHELAHVKHRDTLTMTITATLAGALSMLANFALFFGGSNRQNPLGIVGTLLLMFLAPMAAMVVQMFISRSNEYAADRGGAEICGQPLWLASALAKLDQSAKRIDNPVAEDNPATAHMFIINPLHAKKVDSLFSTHPNTANRIAALKELDAEWKGGGGAPMPQTATRKGTSSIPRAGGKPRNPWS